MELARHESAGALLSIAGDYLVAREAEHNLALGILATLRDQPGVYRETPYLATLSEAGRVALVAVRTPPHGPVLSQAGVPRERIAAAIDLLVADLHAGSPELPSHGRPGGGGWPAPAIGSSCATGRSRSTRRRSRRARRGSRRTL